MRTNTTCRRSAAARTDYSALASPVPPQPQTILIESGASSVGPTAPQQRGQRTIEPAKSGLR